MSNFLQPVARLLQQRIVYHALAWTVLLVALVSLGLRNLDVSFWYVVSNEMVNVAFYALIYYLNSEYLVPRYLATNRTLEYFSALIGTALLITPIKIFVLYLKSYGDPDRQAELVANQGYYFIISLLTAGSALFIKITSDWEKQSRRNRELETRTMQSELNFLKSQINPHFLFNTLNSLYALTLRKSNEAPEVVLKLSEMMRYMLYECNERRVLLSKEVAYLRNYLDLERLRHKHTDIHFDIDGEVHDQLVAPLIFITFVENAFKHGASNHLSAGFVHIHLHVSDDELNLYVENSKPESPPAQEHRRAGGIGLVNAKRRLALMYPRQYQLEITDNPHTYGVNLWMQIKKVSNTQLIDF